MLDIQVEFMAVWAEEVHSATNTRTCPLPLSACYWSFLSQSAAVDTTGLNRYTFPDIDMQLLNAPLGATAVLLFAVPESKLSQPRNVVGEPSPALIVCICIQCGGVYICSLHAIV